MQALERTLSTIVSEDWLTKPSGAAGILVMPSIALEPLPPVLVTVPAVGIVGEKVDCFTRCCLMPLLVWRR
jgi:hypothetical protein